MKTSNRLFPASDYSVANLESHRAAGAINAQAEELRSSLVKELSIQYAGLDYTLIHQAVNEAHALASLTTVPLLLLPVLAEEKVRQAGAWSAQQRSLLKGRQFAFAA